MSLCPCGSKQMYAACCGKFIDGAALPETPEVLMRSRYTAYTKGHVDYIAKTQKGAAAEGFHPEETRRWAKRAKWLDLSILKVTPIENDQGFVEFVARYLHGNKIQQIHERSEFRRMEGQWYYVNSHAAHGAHCGC